MRRTTAAIVALALLAAACGDDADNADEADATPTTAAPTTEPPTTAPPTTAPPTTEAATTTTTVAPARSSEGCGPDRPVSGAQTTTIPTTDGLSRTFRMHVPTGYDSMTATPLVLNFHGLTSNIDQQVMLSRLEPLANAETFVVITPQGTDRTPGVPFWNASPFTDDIVDDTQFVHELLDEVESFLCVDLDRVYSTGMSNGGFMSSHLACAMPDRIAAIASVTGITRPEGCAGDRAVPVLHFHGTDDAVVTYDSIPGRVEAWAEANGCGADPAATAVSAEVEQLVYDCPDGADVEFYIVDGGGHTWPGTPLTGPLAAILGYTTLDIDATALAWTFFESHPIT